MGVWEVEEKGNERNKRKRGRASASASETNHL